MSHPERCTVTCCGIALHVPVIGAAPAFWRDPIDNLVRIHNVTGLAMDAVREIYLQPPATPGLFDHFIDVRGTEVLARISVFPGAPVYTDVCVGNLQMARLIFGVFSP